MRHGGMVGAVAGLADRDRPRFRFDFENGAGLNFWFQWFAQFVAHSTIVAARVSLFKNADDRALPGGHGEPSLRPVGHPDFEALYGAKFRIHQKPCVRWETVGLASSGRIAGSSRHLGRGTNAVIHLVARLEGHDKPLRDEDLLAGSRVPCFVGGPLLDFEDAETPQLDASFGDQRRDDGVHRLLDDFLSLQHGGAGLLGDGSGNFLFRHDSVLLHRIQSAMPVGIVSGLANRREVQPVEQCQC